MALDSDNVLNVLVNYLKANTSTMATSLTSSDQIGLVDTGDIDNVPTQIGQYPALIVNLTNEIERFAQLGQRNNHHELVFSIWPLIYFTDRKQAQKDMRKLVQNVKTVLKNNITLSSTAMSSLPEEVSYLEPGGTFNAGARILFRTRHIST